MKRFHGLVWATILGVGAAQADELACQGPFAKDSSHKRLVEAYGAANVVVETVDGAEGVETKASVIYPKDDARRVEVFWLDEARQARPASIQIAGTGWTGPQGIRVGMDLKGVEAANGKPFSLYGFNWDYGGTASDWKKGKLAAVPGGCSLLVVFEPDEKASETALNRVGGDTQFSSASKGIQAVKPRVQKVSVGYPE
ncbi:hypothetical protein [Microvirga pudoricolor]|uniref:hypothetical protein n=1 Tax=Microvirga pudoricolor TaxID=2778729 RepID=UPI001950192D|nr:hypothetical protein [Microvirga pudoricolor]MBM6595760.1 hypothetical protein [Microvirga pudoricolor]